MRASSFHWGKRWGTRMNTHTHTQRDLLFKDCIKSVVQAYTKYYTWKAIHTFHFLGKQLLHLFLVEDISKATQDYIYWKYVVHTIIRTTLTWLIWFCYIQMCFVQYLNYFYHISNVDRVGLLKYISAINITFCLLINFIHMCVDRWWPNITNYYQP